MKLERAQVEHVARLARLRLSAGEVEKMRAELGEVLTYVDRLAAMPGLDEALPTSHCVPVVCPLRDDVPRGSLARDDALAGAPARDGDEIVVPKVL